MICTTSIHFHCGRQNNMNYQLFNRVLLLLHYGHICRGLLLCGIHVLLLIIIIQQAECSLDERKLNLVRRNQTTLLEKAYSYRLTSLGKLAFLLNMRE